MLSLTRARASTILVVLAALILAACGGDDDAAAPAERTPADALAYGEVVVRPEGDLQANLEEVLSSFPEGEQAGDRLIQAIEEESDGEVNYAEDIEPWLGQRAAAFAIPAAEEGGEPFGAALIEATDEQAARDFLDQAAEDEDVQPEDYQGVELLVDQDGVAGAVFDGLLAFGQREAVEAAIDTRETENLADSDRYTEAVERTDEDTRLAFAVVDVEQLVEVLPEEGTGVPPDQLLELIQGSGGDPSIPLVVSASVDESVVRFEQSSGGAETVAGGEALGTLPADSIFAFALSGLPPGFAEGFELGFSEGLSEQGLSSEDAEQSLEQQLGVNPLELVESIEAFGLFVRGGGTDVGGAAFVELGSEQEVTDTVGAAQRVLEESGVQVQALSGSDQPSGGGQGGGQAGRAQGGSGQGGEDDAAAGDAVGFTATVPDLPFPLIVTGEGTRLVVATDPDHETAARGEGVETLADSGRLDEAAELLGEDFEPTLIADGNAIVGLLGAAAAAEPSVQEALPYLQPIGRIVAGSKTEGDLVVSSFAIEVE